MDLWPPGMLGMPLNRQQRLELIRIAKVHGCRLQECTRDLAEASKSCANCLRGAEKQAFEVLCEDFECLLLCTSKTICTTFASFGQVTGALLETAPMNFCDAYQLKPLLPIEGHSQHAGRPQVRVTAVYHWPS